MLAIYLDNTVFKRTRCDRDNPDSALSLGMKTLADMQLPRLDKGPSVLGPESVIGGAANRFGRAFEIDVDQVVVRLV
jgi:hypothetical protein